MKYLSLIPNEEPYIFINVHILKKEVYSREQFTFNAIQMFKVLNFLSQLEEQPIVVEFDQYDDEKLSINFSQFVRSF